MTAAYQSQLIDVDTIMTLKRYRSDVGDVSELAFSLLQDGQLQPILVRPHTTIPGKYLLVDGGRRLAAAHEAEMQQIAAVIRPMSDLEARAAELAANTQRVGFNHWDAADAALDILPLFEEQARANQRATHFGSAAAEPLMAQKGRAKDHVARLVGMSRTTLDKLLKVYLWCEQDPDNEYAQDYRTRLTGNESVSSVYEDWQRYLNAGADNLTIPHDMSPDPLADETGDISNHANTVDELVARRAVEQLHDTIVLADTSWADFTAATTRSEAEPAFGRWRANVKKMLDLATRAYANSGNARRMLEYLNEMDELGRVDDAENWRVEGTRPVYVGPHLSRNGAH